MNTIEQQLKKIQTEKRIGLMTHVVVGYPSLDATIEIIKTMAEHGADFIELQIPFSDPLADGPTIMRACEKSLEHGTKVKDSFMIMKKVSSQVSIPLFFMAYYNTVFTYGVKRFCKDAQAAGARGLIVPDMAIDEEPEEHFLLECKRNNLCNIQVISPASTPERLRKNAHVANGFIYCTARQGTTGAQDRLDPQLSLYLKNIRKFVSIPLAVGFGISKKSHMQALKPHADIAVVGSALIDVINSSKEGEMQKNIKHFLTDLCQKK